MKPWIFIFCFACNQASLQELPEASVDACVPHAVAFCDAGSQDAQGCVPDPNNVSEQLLPDASLPVGCIANVIGSKRDVVTGQCILATTCTCQSDGAAPQWACSP